MGPPDPTGNLGFKISATHIPLDITDLKKVAFESFRDQLDADSAFIEYFSDFSGAYAEFGKAALDYVVQNRTSIKHGKGRAVMQTMLRSGKTSPLRVAEASMELACRLA